MKLPSGRRAELFSGWLETYVTGQSTPDDELTSDPALRNLCASTERFHGLSEAWAQNPTAYVPPNSSWEDLMASRSPSLPRPVSLAGTNDRVSHFPGRWDTWNRIASAVLVAAMIVAIGAGTWRVVGDRGSGTTIEPSSTTGMQGLAPTDDDSAMATPSGSPEADNEGSDAATTPIEQLPGLQSAVLRSYGWMNQAPSIADLTAIGVSVYRFDTPENTVASYDLLVSSATADFETQTNLNPGSSVVAEDLDGIGERANLVRLDSAYTGSYQSQQYLFTLHQHYVFAVMTVTGGPLASAATPVSNAEATEAVRELAKHLIEQGQPSQEAARFYADGTSSGGDWGFMPPADDPLVAGMTPHSDQQLHPVDSSNTDADTLYPPDAQDLNGIVGAVFRDYYSANTFTGSQSVSLEAATPMTDAQRASTQFSTISISVYQMETAKDASVAYDEVSTGYLGSLTTMNQTDGEEKLLSEDLDGVGDQATYSQLTITSTGGDWVNQMTFQYITVQRGEFVFVISSQSRVGPIESLPATATANQPDPMVDLAMQIVAEGQPSSDDPIFAPDGTSTGGLWGFMPAAGDPLLMGLVPMTDYLLYPMPGQ